MTTTSPRLPLLALAVALVAGVVATAACGDSPEAQEPPPGEATTTVAGAGTDDGGTPSLERLRGVMEADPEGVEGDRAALVLGSRLVELDRHAEALAPLARAAAAEENREYAAILFARAALDGELADANDEARALLDAVLDEGDLTDFARAEALHLASRLAVLAGDWEAAAEASRALLDAEAAGGHADRARWTLAEALAAQGEEREALAVYREIWYETPGSRWALEARGRATRLATRLDAPPPERTAEERLEQLRALQAAGLHEPAVEEAEAFRAALPGHAQTDEALHREAVSRYWLRHNDRVVEIAETMRRRHPTSEWTPATSLKALEALRRSDATAEIRRWAELLRREHARRPEAREAHYALGVYLGYGGKEAEGVALLQELVAEGGDHPRVADALWKVAWFERGRGRTAEAVEALEAVLARFPDTGYRKAALYWTARFVAPEDAERAAHHYRTAAAEYPHDYYGHLAAERLRAAGEAVPEAVSPPFPAVDLLDDPERRDELGDAYRRAVELRRLGLYGFAAAELATLDEVATDPDLQFARAWLAARSGDTWTAIGMVEDLFEEHVVRGDMDALPRPFWEIAFPFRFRGAITDAVAATGLPPETLDPYLVAALARRESRFQPDVVSPAGATGLMQLMPATAERVARKHGLPAPSRADLFDPRVNVALGTRYLGDLLRLFDGEKAPAIASYNAGEEVVGRWWRARPRGQELDEWIENVPYAETRLYVKKILGDVRNYRRLYAAEAGGEGASN